MSLLKKKQQKYMQLKIFFKTQNKLLAIFFFNKVTFGLDEGELWNKMGQRQVTRKSVWITLVLQRSLWSGF